MKITQFLTGVAAAALLTGASSAYTITLGDTNIAASSTSGFELEAATVLAEEIDFDGTSVDGSVEFFLNQPDDNVFTTDDVIVRVDLTNAVLEADVTNANIDATCGTSASVSAGGQEDDTFVEFLVSGLDGCDNSLAGFVSGEDLGFSLPVQLTGNGTFSLNTNILTDSGDTPVDGGDPSNGPLVVAELANAYDVEITPATSSLVADLDTDPIYTAFQPVVVSGSVLGTVELICLDSANSTPAYLDLDGTNNPVDCSTDVDAIDAVLTGDLAAYDNVAPATGIVDIGTVNGTVGAGTADFDLSGLLVAAGISSQNVELLADGSTAINPSAYSLAVTVNLAAGLVDEPVFNGSLANVTREGTTVTIPWTPSATQNAGSGAFHIVRLGNLSNDDARVFVEVRNSSEPGYVNPGVVQIADLPAGGELQLTSQAIEQAVGNWGRGDIDVTVEATPENVTAKRIAVAANGDFGQIEGGTVQQDQN